MRGEKYEPVFYNKCTSHVSESKNIYLHTWNGTDTVYERNCFYPLRRGFCESAGCFFRRIQFRVHYPVLSALLHQLGQNHNLVEVALDLDLALCDCNLRDQLAADNFFDIGQ